VWVLVVAIEERFLHCASRQLRRSEVEEEASAYFGRNDSWLLDALFGNDG
jgi:hypothetical protein